MPSPARRAAGGQRSPHMHAVPQLPRCTNEAEPPTAQASQRPPRQLVHGFRPFVEGLEARVDAMVRRCDVLCVVVAAAAGGMPRSDAWSAGHSLINRAVLPMMPEAFQQRLGNTSTVWPTGDGTKRNLSAFVGGSWAESGDTVAGPCAATLSTPCAPGAVRAKMELRNYCCEPCLCALGSSL